MLEIEFYPPERGCVKIDGHEIPFVSSVDIDRSGYKINLIPQDIMINGEIASHEDLLKEKQL